MNNSLKIRIHSTVFPITYYNYREFFGYNPCYYISMYNNQLANADYPIRTQSFYIRSITWSKQSTAAESFHCFEWSAFPNDANPPNKYLPLNNHHYIHPNEVQLTHIHYNDNTYTLIISPMIQVVHLSNFIMVLSWNKVKIEVKIVIM